MKELIRTCKFRPYLSGMGPVFTLKLYDMGSYDKHGKACVGYRLSMKEPNKTSMVLFDGSDFHCSPMYAIDSDECVNSLMNFLTLRPGEADKEYFDAYTDTQLDYCNNHAESLSCIVHDRFGDM